MFARWQATAPSRPSPDDPGEPFVIAVPPPNVTGSLHMGHALNGSMQDVIVRLRRMQGRKALWICGTDHAGIATQNVVERMLGRVNLTREELGREEFVKRVWNWREESGATIIDQFQQLGCSLDYEHERFTMDDDYARAVIVVFVELHERGYLYRANRMINWCTQCATAISDLEVEHERGRRHALLRRLPARRRRPCHRRDRAAGDAAGRHRRRRQPGGRALREPDRRARDRAARRPRGADRRRRARRSRRRHRRAQGDAGPRPERPRDRAPPRSRRDRGDRLRRPHDRRRRASATPG